jgi:putative tricarboxylic transport membrane protein
MMIWQKATIIMWLVLGLLITEESYRLGLGHFGKPDSGFFPFLIGIFLVGLAIISWRQPLADGKGKERPEGKINYFKIFWCLLSLYVYAITFEWLGFVPATFFLLVFLLKFIERKGWVLAVTVSLLTAVASYIFFGVLLQAFLPKGILGI